MCRDIRQWTCSEVQAFGAHLWVAFGSLRKTLCIPRGSVLFRGLSSHESLSGFIRSIMTLLQYSFIHYTIGWWGILPGEHLFKQKKLGEGTFKLKLQYFGYLIRRANSLENTLMLGSIKGRRRRGDRGWDGWMASQAQWTWFFGQAPGDSEG